MYADATVYFVRFLCLIIADVNMYRFVFVVLPRLNSHIYYVDKYKKHIAFTHIIRYIESIVLTSQPKAEWRGRDEKKNAPHTVHTMCVYSLSTIERYRTHLSLLSHFHTILVFACRVCVFFLFCSLPFALCLFSLVRNNRVCLVCVCIRYGAFIEYE